MEVKLALMWRGGSGVWLIALKVFSVGNIFRWRGFHAVKGPKFLSFVSSTRILK